MSFAIAAAALGLFAFIPAVGVAVMSLTNVRGLPGIPANWVGFDNYVSLFSRAHLKDFLDVLSNTLIFATVGTISGVLLGLGGAVLLNRPLKGKGFYRSVVFMPTVLGVTVTALLWSLMFNVYGGPIQSVLRLFGSESAFFGDQRIALYLALFVQLWSGTGVLVVLFLAGLQAIPDELYDSADVDGASKWQQFRHVTMPMLAPVVTANSILGIISALSSYQLIFVLTGTSNDATRVMSLWVYQLTVGANQSGVSRAVSQGYAAAVSMVQFVLVGVLALLALWWLRRREERLS